MGQIKQRELLNLVSQFTVVTIIAVIAVYLGWLILVPAQDAESEVATQASAIDEKQTHWEGNRPDSFQYVLEHSCFCGSETTTPYLVTEEGGRRTAEYVNAIESGTLRKGPSQPLWIADLFEIAREAIRNNTDVKMSFNEQFGYPSEVRIIPGCADCNDRYSIYNFEVMESNGHNVAH